MVDGAAQRVGGRRSPSPPSTLHHSNVLPASAVRGVSAALVLSVALGLAAGCRGPEPAARHVSGGAALSAEAAALAAVEAYYTALSARDWEAFADCFWPGATITTVWQPEGEPAPRVFSVTVPEFVAKAPEGPGSREIFEERLVRAETWVQGDLAQVRADYEARFGDPGDVLEWTGVDALTLVRHAGRWRITSLAFAPDG